MCMGVLSTEFGGKLLHSNRVLNEKSPLLPSGPNPHLEGTPGLPLTVRTFSLSASTLLLSEASDSAGLT